MGSSNEKKLNSGIVVCNEELYINVDLLGYDDSGLWICIIGGIPMIQPEDEQNCFVRIDDAIDMNIRETNNYRDCKEAERSYRLLLVREFHGWKDKFIKGDYTYKFSDEFVIGYECFWASRTGHEGRRKALRIIRENRPDLFGGRNNQKSKSNVDSVVYFVQGKITKNIKIGFSRDPNRRRANLQSGASEELVLLKWIRGGEPLEKELHRRFSHLRLQGEWFKYEPELIDYIESLDLKDMLQTHQTEP